MAIRNLIVDAIADDAITGEKISGFSTATTGFILAKTSSGASWQAAADPNPTMGGDLSGLASNAQIVANAITANEISAGAVGTTEIATNAVTANEIVAGAVGSSEIADDAVTSNKIPTGAITTAKIASTINLSSKTITFPANSIGVTELNVSAGTAGQALTIDGGGALGFVDVTSDPTMGGDLSGLASNAQITAGAVGTTQLANNSVTSDKIGVDVIVAEDIAANAITVAELQDGAVTTAKIAADAVTANEIATGAITFGKIHNSVSMGGPSQGTGSIIRTNSNAINEDLTLASDTNGVTMGPVTVTVGNTVTVNGQWKVI